MELFYAGSRLAWKMQVHLSLLSAVKRLLQRSFVRKISSFLREISCPKKKKFCGRGKIFQKVKKSSFIILEQGSERLVLFPILQLTFCVVLNRSQVPSCSELSIKSEQFYFCKLFKSSRPVLFSALKL